MGRATCRALLATDDLELVAAVARATGVGHELRELVPEAPADLLVGESLSDLVAAEAEVVVDFSRPEATMTAVEGLLRDGVHLVSGTTGLPAAALDQLAALAGKADHGNAVWAPNFALGAALVMHFATIAARWYPAAEVIELHHQGKVDAPSGTAIRTANAMAAAQRGGSGEPQGGAPVEREGSGEPQGGAPVDREGSGEPRRGAPVDREGSGEPRRPEGSGEPQRGAPVGPE